MYRIGVQQGRYAMMRILATVILGFSLMSFASAAEDVGHEYVYIQATKSKDIWVLDAVSFEIAGHIPIGDYTDDVIGSADGRFAFGNAQIPTANSLSPRIAEAGKVFAIDTATDRIIWSTYVEGSPNHLAVSPDGKRLYVPLFDRNHILVLDARSGELVERWHSFLGNHTLELSKDGKTLYVGNMVAQVISAYDTAGGPGGKLIKRFAADAAVRPLVLDPSEKNLIYQLDHLHGFKVRDVATGEIKKSINLPAMPNDVKLPEFYPYTVDHGLRASPDGKLLLAAGSLVGYVAAYSLPDYNFLGTIKVGEDPNWIRFRGDSKIAFVSNRGSNTISILDLQQMKEIKQVPIGQSPERLDVIRVPERHVAKVN